MITSNDKRTSLTYDFVVGHEYEVVVRAMGPDGTQEPIESAARNSIVIHGKQAAPSPPTGLATTGYFNAIALSWTNPADYDLKHVEVWSSTNNNVSGASKIAEVKGLAYLDVIGVPNSTRYYWIKAINTSDVASAFYPSITAGISGRSVGVEATDIADFAVTATKQFTNTVVLTGDAWTNNSPGAGSIAWNAHSIVYGGASYPITAGNTALAYVYWTIGAATYSASATHPALGTTAFMIAINTAGTHTLVWNSSANMVIGTAFIANLAVTDAKIANATITNAKIANVDATKITTGTLVVARTEAKCTDALADQTGANTAANITGQGALATLSLVEIAQLGTTVITGGYIKTGLVSCDNIDTGTLTGRLVRTDTGAAGHYKRVELDVSDNTVRVYNEAGANVITLDDGSNFGGNAPIARLHEDTYGGQVLISRGAADADDLYIQLQSMAPPFINVLESAYIGTFVSIKNAVDASGGTFLYAGVDFNNLAQFTVNDHGDITGESLRLHGVGGSTLSSKDSVGTTWYPLIYDGTTHAWQSSGVQKMALDASGNLSLSGTVDGVNLSNLGSAAYTATGDYAPAAHVGAGGGAHADVVAAGADGFMTGADKTKLNGIDSGADVTGSNAPQAHDQANSTITGGTANAVAVYTAGGVLSSSASIVAAELVMLNGVTANLADALHDTDFGSTAGIMAVTGAGTYTVVTSTNSGGCNVTTELQFSGTDLQEKHRYLYWTNGVLTQFGSESGWTNV